MKKKQLLFVIESLSAAGAEKSLVTFLSLLDYSRFDVDLQLFKYGGEFDRYIPSTVNVLPPIVFTNFLEKSFSQQLLTGDLRKLIARLKYTLSIRLGDKSIKSKARKYWNYFSSCIDHCPHHYDVAIAYGQCLPTFYVVDKVNAFVKIGWVNCIYHLDGFEREYQQRFYEALDKIVLVSNAACNHFMSVYPFLSEKMIIIHDMINPINIEKMSISGLSFQDNYNGTRILTVARLDKRDKGYDISLEACRILHDRGLEFKWYAIGRGEYRQEMEQYIADNHLQDCFILLGTTHNPYSYIKNCTLYVQTSRHEGFGLSIAEARILNKPVVTTEFDAVYNQMIQGKNGIVVKQDPVAVADAIERLIGDQRLYKSIVEFQKTEKKGNSEEMLIFYRLIDETTAK